MGRELDVGEDDAGARLDVFLTRRVDGLSRARVRRMIADGLVRLDGRLARKGGVSLERGATVVLLAEPPPVDFVPAAPDGRFTLDVVYEDTFLVVVDKPAGVPTHPLRPEQRGTLASALLERYPEMERVGYASREPGIVHRLDNETSGLLLAARDAATFEATRQALGGGAIDKRYDVLLEGRLDPERAEIDAPIGKHRRDARRVTAYLDRSPQGARPARTQILTSRAVGAFTHAEVRASVAVRHQIRAHFAAIGHPLVGDARYGGGHREALGRHFLHASSLAFVHPRTGEALDLRSPLPSELREFLLRHR